LEDLIATQGPKEQLSQTNNKWIWLGSQAIFLKPTTIYKGCGGVKINERLEEQDHSAVCSCFFYSPIT
jgi:hypothetical protein